MLNDFDQYKIKKYINQSAISMKSAGILMGEAFYKFAYNIRESESQLDVNRRNNEKLNKK